MTNKEISASCGSSVVTVDFTRKGSASGREECANSPAPTILEELERNNRRLAALVAELERQRDSGQYICAKCHLRQDPPGRDGGF